MERCVGILLRCKLNKKKEEPEKQSEQKKNIVRIILHKVM